MRNRRFVLTIALIGIILVGCAQTQVKILPTRTEMPAKEATAAATSQPTQDLPDGLPTPLIDRMPKPTPTNLPPELADALERKLVILATQDLAERLDLAQEAVQLVQLEAITWPDASLGCPQPDMVYAQVLTPGYRITLEADGQTYQYNSDKEGTFLLCDPDSPPILQRTPEWRLPPSE